MGQQQTTSRHGRPAPLLLGKTPFCCTAAVGEALYVMAPGEIKAKAAEGAVEAPADSNAFKKKSSTKSGFSSALSLARKGVALAAKGAKVGAKMLMGSKLRPCLVRKMMPRAHAFSAYAAQIRDEGKAAAYGVPCYLSSVQARRTPISGVVMALLIFRDRSGGWASGCGRI